MIWRQQRQRPFYLAIVLPQAAIAVLVNIDV